MSDHIYPVFTGDPVSEDFIEALGSGVGSCEAECHCGRLHLCPDSNFAKYENEGPDFESRKKANPDQVVLNYEVDGVGVRYLNGCAWVIGCPCNQLAKFESFIWSDRDVIRRYIVAKSKRLAAEAAELLEQTKGF